MPNSPTNQETYGRLVDAYESHKTALNGATFLSYTETQRMSYLKSCIDAMLRFTQAEATGTIVPQSELQDLLNQLLQKNALLEALRILYTSISPGEFDFETNLSGLPHCSDISPNLLLTFKKAVKNVYLHAAHLSKDAILFANDLNEDKKPSLNDVKLLTEVAIATNQLFYDPIDKKSSQRFEKSINALNPGSFNYQALVGNSLVVVAVLSIALLFPAITLTCGFPLGLGVALLGTMIGFFGQAMTSESHRDRPQRYLQNTKLTVAGEKLKTTASKVRSAVSRYGFFSTLSDTSVLLYSSSDVVSHGGGLPIMTR
jgi:hypothetical protein